jgi:hypothetical protein
MASKKYLLLAGMCCLLASTGFSQRVGASYDVKDSSVIRSKDMAQHSEFLNGTYNFPAKPRNQWEVGLKIGSFKVGGDIPTQFSPGFGLHIRKAFGYVFSMRAEYTYGIGKGLHFRSAQNFGKNSAWEGPTLATRYSAPYRSNNGPIISTLNQIGGAANAPFETVFYNYKAKVQELTLQGLVTMNNIRFHKAKTGFNVYLFVGAGAMSYDTRVNALNGASKYNFSIIANAPWKDR